MNRSQLVKVVAERTGIPEGKVMQAIIGLCDGITSALKEDDVVTLVNFGSFSVANRAARKGWNLNTGDVVHIPSRRQPHFKAGKLMTEL